MTSTRVPVTARRPLAPDIHSLTLSAPTISRKVRPGQFLNVRIGDGPDPVLRRPLSVADAGNDTVRLVLRVVGRGTAALARLRRGDLVDVLGPLGKPAPFFRGRDIIVCGGGVGIAPLLLTARRLKVQNRVRVLLGARTRDQLILRSEFVALGVPVKVATDDGSAGYHGMVTELAARAADEARNPVLFACGPKPMLADLVRRVEPAPVWGFIEERMGCGTGICYCCALPRRGGGYVRFCEEGPVVLLNEVEL